MPLLNYTTTVDAAKTVGEVQVALVKAGARSIHTEYSPDGKVVALAFGAETLAGPRQFVLPVQVGPVLTAMKNQKVQPRYLNLDHAERVAWRILKDWIEAQLALITVGLASLDQVMLPYMADANGVTVYELYADRQLALGTG